MNPVQYERVFEVFRAALERPAAERATYVAESCGSDGALRQEVEALLAADADPDDALAETGLRAGRAALMDVLSGGQSTDTDDDELPDRIGRYRVIRKIGQGRSARTCHFCTASQQRASSRIQRDRPKPRRAAGPQRCFDRNGDGARVKAAKQRR